MDFKDKFDMDYLSSNPMTQQILKIIDDEEEIFEEDMRVPLNYDNELKGLTLPSE